MLSDKPVKRAGKRPGRKPSKIDVKARLERSRQSARECRARKKLRYQYLEELVLNREKAIFELRDELEVFKQWCIQVDSGVITDKLLGSLCEDSTTGRSAQGQGQGSSSSLRGSGRTSTVTSGTGSYLSSSATGQGDPYGHFQQGSRTFEQGQSSSRYTGASVRLQGSSVASQLHGAGAQVHDTSVLFQDSASSQMQLVPGHSRSLAGAASLFGGSDQAGGALYSGIPQYQQAVPITNYNSPVTQSFINLDDVNNPTNTLTDVPMTTLTSIMPRNTMPQSFSSYSNPQPSTSQTVTTTPDSTWYSLFAEYEANLSRQGAESASGTPVSVDGVRQLPTVIQDILDSSDSSDS